MTPIHAARHKRDKAAATVEQLTALAEKTDARAVAATPGAGRRDPGVLSGIRRKPNAKADARRYAAYSRDADAVLRLVEAQRNLRIAEGGLKIAKRDAAAPRDVENLRPGDLVRNSTGWHRIVRVSAKSVSVETGYSWTDRITYDRIIETRIDPARLPAGRDRDEADTV